ncbi:unnamed protein product, partial [Mesorhabditis belari]|uniref:BZIP domain-containing protein n=1 Tax=Mesorhabditis belari TaxID=2138241 RepID=A0AAF3FNG1_9BILA
MYYPFPRFGDSLSIAAELQEKDKQRNPNQNSFMEADVNIENYLKELQNESIYSDDPIQDDPDMAKTAFAMEQSAAYESMHNNRLSHLPHDDGMDDVFNFNTLPSSSHHQGPIISTSTAPLVNKVKHEPWEDEPSTSAITRPTVTAPKASVPKFATPALPKAGSSSKGNGYTSTTRARKYNLKPKEEKETTNYKIKRMRNNDAVRRSRMKAKEEQEKRDKELMDLRNEKNKVEQDNKHLRATLLEIQRKCRCGHIGNLKI